MAGWSAHKGTAVVLPLDNIDTDQLIPARFMSTPRAQGYGGLLLHDLRRDKAGALLADFPLNRCLDATILIAGRNFGSGSSREAAVYALVDAGIRVVIAPGFGDIFAANAVNNGLCPARLAPGDVAALSDALTQSGGEMTVRLDPCEIRAGDLRLEFELDDSRRTKLMNGWDDIDLTLRHRAEIAAFRERREAQALWAWPSVAETAGETRPATSRADATSAPTEERNQ